MRLRTSSFIDERALFAERGAVTAEFAVVLPAVALILAISLGSLSAQVERMRLVSVAAGLARAIGRGETQALALERFQPNLAGRKVAFSAEKDLVCAEVSLEFDIVGLPGPGLRLADRECARKLGL